LKNNFKKFELKFDKKDFIIIFIITAIYAVVAFTNLGALEVPQKGGILNEDITVEFEGEEQISTAVFYNSIGQGECEFYYKAPNGDYSQIYDIDGNKQTFSYVNSMMYVWQPVDLYVKTDSIKISVKTPGMNVLEMAFFNENGERIEIKSVSGNGGNTQFLYDEQNLALYDGTYLDEMYFDEIYHARTAYENIHGMQPYEITHPPLGKIILSIGINIFGMVPFGWRFMGTLFGVLMLPLFYIIGKMLFKKHFYAGVMTALFAADFMHFAQTRIATIDSYSVFFILLMFLFMLWYTKTNYNRQPLKETLLPLFLCGISFGLGAATKWLCIYSGAGLAVIFIGIQIKRKFEYDRLLQGGEKVCSYKSNLIKTILWCVLFFIIIPLCIYFASYTPRTSPVRESSPTITI
jgi:dolichyl-phosphate-mannose-protein mannosyltransferase